MDDITQDPEYRALVAEARMLETSILATRAAWARQVGFTFDNRRDMYGVLGYRDLITTSEYRAKYQRGGLAGRIIDVFPNATWRGGIVELIENDSKEDYTPFEQAWVDLEREHQLQNMFLRVDKLSLLSNYAVLLLGALGNLEEELPKIGNGAGKILYVAPYIGGGGPMGGSPQDKAVTAGADASVFEYELDPKNERFGLPKMYQLRRTTTPPETMRLVHWTRMIHIAEGLLDDDVFGLPGLERVWNLLEDLEKVTGGGGEAFWLRANQGFHINIDKEMALPPGDDTIDKLRAQVDNYKHGLDRWLRTRGADVNVLGSDVANFSGPADTIITQIAGAKGIPKRILTGSEMGELASSQDRDNWADQITGRQQQYAGPQIVRQFADRMIAYGYLPTPVKGPNAYEVKWPHIQTLTEQERAAGALSWAQTNQVQGDIVYTDAEIRDHWSSMGPLSDEQRKEIADRNAEKLKQQQDALAVTAQQAVAKTDLRSEDQSKPGQQPKGKFPRAAGDATYTYIRQDGDRWCVYALDGRKLGEHDTLEDAQKQQYELMAQDPGSVGGIFPASGIRLSAAEQYKIAELALAIEAGDDAAILRALEFDPTQPRDDHGRWDKGGAGSGGVHALHTPSEAVHDILAGKKASIHEADVHSFLKKSLKQATPVNLTQLQVEGQHVFGGKGLGIRREEMPQVPKEMRDQFLSELKDRGITATREKVDPYSLAPSQREISAQQVAAKLKKYEDDPKRPFPPIIVSKDDKVLDGHHHWGVMVAVRTDHPDAKIPVYRLSVSAKRGLEEMHAFDKRHNIKREAIKAAEDYAWSLFGGFEALGDLPGHEFHGNQWTLGKGEYVHGSSARNAASILKKGLLTSKAGKVWEQHKTPNTVFMTRSEKDAIAWGKAAAGENHDVALFKIRIPESERNRITGKGRRWSPERTFSGDIKPEWIVDHKIIKTAEAASDQDIYVVLKLDEADDLIPDA